MIPQLVTPPRISHQPTSSPNFGLPHLPSPSVQPLPISPPRFPPPVSPPHKSPTSLRGPDTFTHMVPTHFDVRNQTHSLSHPKSAGTTAQDLLNGVLGIPSSTNDPAPAAATLLSGLGGSTSSVWSLANDVRHPPIGQQRHQRSVSQSHSSSLAQSSYSSYLSWQSSQLSQQHTDITPHPRLNPIGHHRVQSSGVPSHLTSSNIMTNNLLNAGPGQLISGTSLNYHPIDTSGGLGGSPVHPLVRQGLSPTSQSPSYNPFFGNSLGIRGSGWER